MKLTHKLFAIFLSCFLLFSCSKDKEKRTAELAYVKAMKLLKEKNYSEAAEQFEKIDDEFPFSKWAIKAQTIAVYARYKDSNYEKMLANIDDFIRLNPGNKYIPYMTYMKGIAYFDQIPNIERSQDDTKQASFTFRELIARFPESKYSSDAKTRLSFIDEHLAGSKMSVGRYEISKRNYVGAILNFKEVTSRYRLTKQVPEAYFRLGEIYKKIGLDYESKKANNFVKTNYPDTYWSDLIRNNEES